MTEIYGSFLHRLTEKISFNMCIIDLELFFITPFVLFNTFVHCFPCIMKMFVPENIKLF